MAFDPNLYAIQIALSIDAGEAFKAVDELESRIGNIEESLSRALTQTLSGVVDVTTEISQSLGAMTGLVDDVNQRYVDQNDQLGETLERTNEVTDDLQKQFDLNEDLQEIANDMFDLAENNQLLQQAILEIINNQHTATEDLTEQLLELGFTLEEIEKIHQRIRDTTERNAAGVRRYRTEFQDVVRTVKEIGTALIANANELADLTKGAEDFVTVNYRAYGTQHDLLNAVAQTAAEYGVFTAQVQEAYKELMGIKVPTELLDRYSGMVAQTSRITGIGIKDLAEYTRTMRGAGLELGDLAYVMEITTAAQRAFGLTAAEVNKVLTEQLDKLALMTAIYGDDVPADMAVAQSTFAGMAKQAGASAAAISKINEIMYATGVEALSLSARLGPKFGQGTEGRVEAINDAFGQLGMTLYEAQQNGNMTREELDMLTINLDANARAMGGNIDMVTMYRNLIAENGGTIEGMNAALEEMRIEMEEAQKVQDEFNQSMNTLYAATESFRASMWALVSPFVNFIAQGMIPIINAFTWMVDTINNVIGVFTGLWAALENLIPPLYYVRMGVATLVAAMILLPGLLTAIFGIFAVGANIMNIFGAAVGFVQTMLAGLATRVAVGLQTMGAAFISFMTTLGAGLNALGMAVQPVMVPLLALGGALLMTAASAYLFAQAVKIIADIGMDAVGAMIGLTVAVGALGLVLVGLGALAQGPIALGLLAVGAALLMVGAAAYMVGAGIGLAANGLATLLDAMGDDFGAKFLGLAAGLTALAIAAYFITPGLLTLGVGLAAIAGVAVAAGLGIYMLAFGLEKMADIEFPDLGGKLILFAAEIAVGAYLLGLVMTPLILAGIGLYLFATGLQQLSGFEVPDLGGKLVLLAGELMIGALLLGAVMTPLALAGVGLYLFATGLQQLSGWEAPDLGGKLIALAGELWVGALILGTVVTPLALAGVGLYLFATGLQQLSGFEVPDLGGKLIALAGELWIGALLLGTVVTPLILAGAGLWVFAQGLQALQDIEVNSFGGDLILLAGELTIAAAILLPAVYLLAMAAGPLITAGMALAIGGTGLMLGAIALGYGVSFLGRAIDRLAESSGTLDAFTDSAIRFSELSFSSLRGAVVELGDVSNGMVDNIDQLVTAAVRMENTEIDAANFADSLTAAASQLDVAAKSLQGPAATLTTEIDGIVTQVERLIAAEAQIKEIGNDIAEVVQQPNDTEQPNEMRNVEKVTEAINAMVNVEQDNAEMVSLLARLVELMEEQAVNGKDRKGFFQNEGGQQPTGKKFREAGVNL